MNDKDRDRSGDGAGPVALQESIHQHSLIESTKGQPWLLPHVVTFAVHHSESVHANLHEHTHMKKCTAIH